MKTRVSKNKELHDLIASDTESDVVSSDLSHFANRLNEIDNQFSRMNIEKSEDHAFEHARQTKVNVDDTLDQNISLEDTQFDTFESAYLKDFLEEVKEYNVKKGYRDIESTSSNIMKELKLDSHASEDSFVRPIDAENLETVLSEIDEEATQIYRAVDHTGRPEHVSSQSLEETISLAVQSMSDDEEEIEIEEFEPEFFEDIEAERSDFARDLLEQTQTLQFKVVDQERSIEEMSHTMVRTNRLLNTVLSLLMLAIVVVLMFILSNILKG